jgi:hypothetical protein
VVRRAILTGSDLYVNCRDLTAENYFMKIKKTVVVSLLSYPQVLHNKVFDFVLPLNLYIY